MDGKRMDTELTVLVCTCDKYRDVLRVFAELFWKQWPDCPYETVVVSESELAGFAAMGFDRCVATGKGKPWCAMLVEGLAAVRTPYVMILMDDYLLTERVDSAAFQRRLTDCQTENAALLRLIPNPKPSRVFDAARGLGEYRKNTAYCVATQAGIWAKDFLERIARNCGKSAWEFERFGSFMTGEEQRPILVTIRKEFPFVDAVHKGYWETFGVKLCRDHGIELDFAARSLPPLKIRLVEGLKALVFAVFPITLIVRVQNRFGLGAKEIARPQAAHQDEETAKKENRAGAHQDEGASHQSDERGRNDA